MFYQECLWLIALPRIQLFRSRYSQNSSSGLRNSGQTGEVLCEYDIDPENGSQAKKETPEPPKSGFRCPRCPRTSHLWQYPELNDRDRSEFERLNPEPIHAETSMLMEAFPMRERAAFWLNYPLPLGSWIPAVSYFPLTTRRTEKSSLILLLSVPSFVGGFP